MNKFIFFLIFLFAISCSGCNEETIDYKSMGDDVLKATKAINSAFMKNECDEESANKIKFHEILNKKNKKLGDVFKDFSFKVKKVKEGFILLYLHNNKSIYEEWCWDGILNIRRYEEENKMNSTDFSPYIPEPIKQ